MQNSKKIISIGISVLLFLAIPLTVFIAQQQQEIRQRAADGTLELTVGDYGKVEQTFGVVIDPREQNAVSEVLSYFPNGQIYIHIKNPTFQTINSQGFEQLRLKNFFFYFSFTQNEEEIPSLLYFTLNNKTYGKPVVVDIENYDKLTLLQEIRSLYGAQIRIHAPILNVWPNTGIIQSELNPFRTTTILSGISYQPFYINMRPTFFSNIRLLVDTFYDQTYDVHPDSQPDMNIPDTVTIALSDFAVDRNQDNQKTIAYVSALLTSAITIDREAANGGQTRIPTLIHGSFLQASIPEKKIISQIALFLQNQPTLLWPAAFANNGGPYNYSPYNDSEEDRIVGVIGKNSNNEYTAILINTADTTFATQINIPLAGYEYYSSQDRVGTLSDSRVTFGPLETLAISKKISPITSPTFPQQPLSPTLPQSTPLLSPTPSPTPSNQNQTSSSLQLTVQFTNAQIQSKPAFIDFYDGKNQKISTLPVVFTKNQNNYVATLSLSSLPQGLYTAKLRAEKYITKQIPLIIENNASITNTVADFSLSPGDTNNDGSLSLSDYVVLKSCFDGSKIRCNNKTNSDLNEDSLVNILDYNILVQSLTNRPGD